MRTRQLRLSDAHQIRHRITEFLGRQINIVLLDKTVMFGELKKVNDAEIVLMNMRLENVTYPFHLISEVFLDTKV